MYQSQQEVQKKEKQYKVYVILFIILTLANIILYFVGGSILRGLVTLLVFAVVLYYGIKGEFWAQLIVKVMVWIYIIVLVIILLIIIL